MTIKHMATALAIMVGLYGATQAVETAETMSKPTTPNLSTVMTILQDAEKTIKNNLQLLNIIESKMVPTNGVTPHLILQNH